MTGSSHVISHRKEVYLLNEHAGIAVDIERFDALADAGDLHARQGNIDEAAQLYRRAAELYAGDLYLRSETDASQIIERERLRTRMERLLANVARWSYERQDIPACVAAAERVLLSDPYQEGMHRLLMRCHLAQGQRSLALRQYLTCKTLLKAEFNADPEAETTELFEFARSSRSARDASATGTKGCSYQVPGAAARLNLPGRTERFEK
jgi:DNA-binding SARP family transcriptional activator